MPFLPPELLLEVIDHISGPALSFPTVASVQSLLALCLTSRSIYPHASQALYSAISVSSPSILLQLSESGVPEGRTVRALFLSRARLSAEQLPAAERLLSSLAPFLERVIFDRRTESSAQLDAHLSLMPHLHEVAFTRQVTELWGLEAVFLDSCPGVRRLALHDYWTEEYHTARICRLFPGIRELVLACDVGVALVNDVLDTCPELKKVTLIKPRPRAGEDWHAPVRTAGEDIDAEGKRTLALPSRERELHMLEIPAPEEDLGDLPSWAADCIRDGECWILNGVERP
ncbi:hypothetical protein CALVIDRAFT_525095 [Calocera viscosa TUFC12733]|uniref:F-box domain-containing protein n=1 Tax=Calocera viscosa (strain TUFC12733) TaxID=1330018 RepID=A0A167QTL3_CALVF|nr:hypothetical protein CALVIDRAFT_525095 [Calocera viscosa TUFC12733]